MLCALFAVEPRLVSAPGVPATPKFPPPLLPQVDPDHARARAIFDAALAGGEPFMTWDEVPGDPPAWGFSQAWSYADLMVLGQKDPSDPFTFLRRSSSRPCCCRPASPG